MWNSSAFPQKTKLNQIKKKKKNHTKKNPPE